MKPNILLCGCEIINDLKLLQLVKNHACLFLQTDPTRLDHDIREQEIDLVVFEFSQNWQANLKILQSLKLSFPYVPIIVVSGGFTTDEVIRSFQFGARVLEELKKQTGQFRDQTKRSIQNKRGQRKTLKEQFGFEIDPAKRELRILSSAEVK